MDEVTKFLNDPLVAPLYGLLVLSLIDMLLGIYRSIQTKTFDFQKLPGILDSTVLQKVIPLAALGIAAFFITDGAAKGALQAAYVAGTVAALASEVTSVIRKVTGDYVPSTLAQDKGLAQDKIPASK
jgi:hypothetical protein